MHKTKQQKWFFPKETILQKRKRRKLCLSLKDDSEASAAPEGELIY